VTISLGGVEYPLYVWSYLGFGNDQARYRKNESVVAYVVAATPVCVLAGSCHHSAAHTRVFSENGYQPVTSDGCIPSGYNTSFLLDTSLYTLAGSSSQSQCILESRGVR